jgi:hypothetical protein
MFTIHRATPRLAVVGVNVSATEQACYPGLRLHDVDSVAYKAQARRVFAAHGVHYRDRRLYNLDRRVPRCLAGGDYDAYSNL